MNQMLEWEFADEKPCALLVLSDFSESNGSGMEIVELLDSSGGQNRLASGFGGSLLPGGPSSWWTCERFACLRFKRANLDRWIRRLSMTVNGANEEAQITGCDPWLWIFDSTSHMS
ncbi:hypothetical protein RJ641_036645 [Dillenia turbinata]|uniref:Uncharacterized protein n=1 Tax=Dillenia turbinata TaxID=194707 RepID=A0AAN8ZD46_9MAGN